MATKVGTGGSKGSNPFEAGKEAATMALRVAGVETCNIVFVSATMGYDSHEELLRGIRSITGDALLLGGRLLASLRKTAPMNHYRGSV